MKSVKKMKVSHPHHEGPGAESGIAPLTINLDIRSREVVNFTPPECSGEEKNRHSKPGPSIP
jgi:hypothetical protein